MKILATSDTHGILDGLDEAIDEQKPDVVVVAGDIAPATIGGDTKDYIRNEFIGLCCNHPKVEFVLTPGNHDIWAQTYIGLLPSDIEYVRPDNLEYFVDSGCEIDGVKFWGSPWVPYICGHWAFESHDEQDESDIAARFAEIPADTDVLITHTPPHLFACALDVSLQTKRGPFGSRALGDLYQKGKIHPKVHFCGHIHTGDHEPYEMKTVDSPVITRIYNVSRVDERYTVAYPFTFVTI